jgi:hypothetical protein
MVSHAGRDPASGFLFRHKEAGPRRKTGVTATLTSTQHASRAHRVAICVCNRDNPRVA